MSMITQREPYYAMVSKDKHNVRYFNKIDTYEPPGTDRQHGLYKRKRGPNIRVKFPYLIVFKLGLLQFWILLVSERITLCLLLHVLAKCFSQIYTRLISKTHQHPQDISHLIG